MLHPGAIFGLVILAIGVPVVAWLNVRAALDKRRQIDASPICDIPEEP